MPIRDKIINEINNAMVNNPESFMVWITNSIPNICDSTEEKEEAIKFFIASKLTPEIAQGIIDKSSDNVERFSDTTKNDTDSILNLFTLGTKDRKYPDAYPQVIRSLISLYQHNKNQTVVHSVIYNLLLIPEFRAAFRDDQDLAPFFMDGFFEKLSTYIKNNCPDPSLKNELLEMCAPKPLQEKNIDSELIKAFNYKEPFEPEQKDIISIQKFLANVKNDSPVMKQLQLLEYELEKHAGKRYDSETKLLEGYEEGKPFRHDKLLSGFLRQWAEENKFTGYGKLKGFMSNDEFFKFIGKGGLFKDPVLRGDFHGEFTHAIQWYLITMWNNEDPDKPKLNCHPSRLLQWMGENKGKFKEWSGSFEASVTSLYKPTATDFRRVDNLHKYLNSANCPFPVLHQLNLGRSAKGKPPLKFDEAEFEEFKPKINP